MSGIGWTAVLVGTAGVTWWMRFTVRRRAIDRWSKDHGLQAAKALLRIVDPNPRETLLRQAATIVRNWSRRG